MKSQSQEKQIFNTMVNQDPEMTRKKESQEIYVICEEKNRSKDQVEKKGKRRKIKLRYLPQKMTEETSSLWIFSVR